MAGEHTSLGKFLRKLRIDRGKLLRTMSNKLGISMSFLSSVENGKKSTEKLLSALRRAADLGKPLDLFF